MEIVAARLGFGWGWDVGENAWNAGVDQNFRMNDTFHGLRIINDGLTAPPGSPADGDTYIPLATATGAWAGHEDKIATYQDGTWYFYDVARGLRAYFVNHDDFRVFDEADTWSTEVSVIDLNAGKLFGVPGTVAAAAQEIGLGNGMTFTGTNLAIGGAGTLVLSGFSHVTGPTPTNAADLVTKAYADAQAQGLSPKPSAVWATTGALAANTYAGIDVGATLTGNSNGAISVDGGNPGAGDTVLVRAEVAGLKNGLYIVTQTGSGGTPYILTRHTSMDIGSEFLGAFLAVESQGAVLFNTLWMCTNATVPTIGTTAITFAQINAPGVYGATGGITLSGTTFSLTTMPTLTLKANVTGGTAAPADKTLLEILDAIIGWNQGDVLIRGAAGVSKVSPAASGLALISNGTSVAPSFSGFLVPVTTYATITTSGSNQATAFALTADVNVLLAGASNPLAKLKANPTTKQKVTNRLGVTATIYPVTGAQIEAVGTNTPVTIADGVSVEFEPTSTTQWWAT